MAMTKEERAAYMRRYYAEHKDEINANKRLNYKRNPAKYKAYRNAWLEKHKNDPEYKAKAKAIHKNWVAKNRDYYNAYQRDYRLRRVEREID